MSPRRWCLPSGKTAEVEMPAAAWYLQKHAHPPGRGRETSFSPSVARLCFPTTLRRRSSPEAVCWWLWWGKWRCWVAMGLKLLQPVGISLQLSRAPIPGKTLGSAFPGSQHLELLGSMCVPSLRGWAKPGCFCNALTQSVIMGTESLLETGLRCWSHQSKWALRSSPGHTTLSPTHQLSYPIGAGQLMFMGVEEGMSSSNATPSILRRSLLKTFVSNLYVPLVAFSQHLPLTIPI